MTWVVLIAFCSITNLNCGLGGAKPDNAEGYPTEIECVKAAARIDNSREELDNVLAHVNIPGPYKTQAVCGTPEQGAEVEKLLRAWNARLAVWEGKRKPSQEPEHPGDRDPFPKGG